MGEATARTRLGGSGEAASAVAGLLRAQCQRLVAATSRRSRKCQNMFDACSERAHAFDSLREIAPALKRRLDYLLREAQAFRLRMYVLCSECAQLIDLAEGDRQQREVEGLDLIRHAAEEHSASLEVLGIGDG